MTLPRVGGLQETFENNPDWAPKKAQREQMSFRERMEEFNNMTLRFDSRKL